MNPDELFKRLIEEARKARPSESVPYAFEKRIMALLPPRAQTDPWAFWSVNLWRSALSCAFVCVVVSVWPYPLQTSSDSAADAASLAFEKEVFASMNQHVADAW